MKIRKRELAKPGIYGTTDNPQVVTEQDLREIAETFPEIKKAPVSLNGHWPDPAAPRLANVIEVAFDEKTKVLSGSIEEQDVLFDAVEKGFYPDVSIGAKRRAADSKMYLHHLAYLGEEPPAIKDLKKDIQDKLESIDDIAASDAGALVVLPPVSTRILVLSDSPSQKPTTQSIDNPTKEAQTMDLLQKLVDAISDPDEKAKAQAALDKAKGTEAEAGRLKEKLEALAEKYPDEEISLSDADPRVNALTRELRASKKGELLKAAAGRIPKAKQELLLALADSFSATRTLELSDGKEKKSVSQYELLSALLSSIPEAVRPGSLDLGDPSGDGLVIDLSGIMACV
jgi:hypothetical protein